MLIGANKAFLTHGKTKTPYERGVKYREYPNVEPEAQKKLRLQLVKRTEDAVRYILGPDGNNIAVAFSPFQMMNKACAILNVTTERNNVKPPNRERGHRMGNQRFVALLRVINRVINNKILYYVRNRIWKTAGSDKFDMTKTMRHHFVHLSQRPYWRDVLKRLADYELDRLAARLSRGLYCEGYILQDVFTF